MTEWLTNNSTSITLWAGALCTFAVYSVLYTENRFYRLFEHIFIGLSAGLGVYLTWSQVLGPMWWDPMVVQGHWYWAYAAVAGSMFYFMYSRKHVWISRIIFGYFMGAAAGGIFRDFFAVYFPQIRSSMEVIGRPSDNGMGLFNALVFYVILFAAMSYFFFSFDHRKHKTLSRSAKLGRWFLMIGFGAIFGATVMGRMTLFIGRFNYLINEWAPQAATDWQSTPFRVFLISLVVLAGSILLITRRRYVKAKNVTPEE